MDSKTSAVLEKLGNKIVRVRDLIRTEQKLRDGMIINFFNFSVNAWLVTIDNVNEYLKLAANADKQQVQRIKAVFEKKNQKSAQIIAQLQRKLDAYQKKVHDVEKGIQSHRPPREVLRDMGQGLKWVKGKPKKIPSTFFVCFLETLAATFEMGSPDLAALWCQNLGNLLI